MIFGKHHKPWYFQYLLCPKNEVSIRYSGLVWRVILLIIKKNEKMQFCTDESVDGTNTVLDNS